MSKGKQTNQRSEKTMKLNREQQLIRLENGLAKGMGGSSEEVLQGTLSLYHAATPEMRKVYWSAIKAMVEWNRRVAAIMPGAKGIASLPGLGCPR